MENMIAKFVLLQFATIVLIQNNQGQSQIDPTTPTPQSSLRSQPTTVPSLPAGFRKTPSQHNFTKEFRVH